MLLDTNGTWVKQPTHFFGLFCLLYSVDTWPLIPALRKERISDFEASQVYRVNSRIAKKPCLKRGKKEDLVASI